MSVETEREGASRRSSSRKSLSETTLPQEYLDKLEEKRKLLDESIHKYIAAKEREYKHFQKELKQKYKLSQGQNGSQHALKERASLNEYQEVEPSTQLDGQRISAVDALLLNAERQEESSAAVEQREDISKAQNRSAIAGLQDGRANVEREKDFLGLFTPDYLPALDAQDAPRLQRSTSAPYSPSRQEAEPTPTSFSRANSDSSAQAKPKRPSHLALVERTSSSGSSADGRLASAMRSPTQRPKQKRVSLAVGDSIVAPSDSVPNALSQQHTTSSHSRKRSSLPEREYPLSIKRSVPEDETTESAVESSPANPDLAIQSNATASDLPDSNMLPSAAMQQSPTSSPRPSARPAVKLDPDGDLFDLHDEDEEAMPSPVDSDDSDNVLHTEDDISGRIEPAEAPLSIPTSSGEVRYDAANGLIPEPKDKDEDSAVPYLAFGPSSAVAPTKPGFRRPSVIDDPVYEGANYDAAEEEAVENEIYGSSYIRPDTKGSFTPGSLGESYMARHAEEMMKMRMAQQQTQVKS